MKILIAPFARKLRNDKQNPKNFPYWSELITLLKGNGITQIGMEGEPQLVENFKKNLPLLKIMDLVNSCDVWISVDSFLQHLAYHQGKRGIVIWSVSDPRIFGYPENLNILKDPKYLREKQFNIWEEQEYNPDAFVDAQTVYNVLTSNFK